MPEIFHALGLQPLGKLAAPLLMLCFAACCAHASAGKDSPQIGERPPELLFSQVVQGPRKEEITWEKLKGKVVVLEFWNTQCGSCIRAIPHLNSLVEKFSSRPVVFLSISDDNRDHLKAFLKKKPIKGWQVLEQPFNPTRTAFDVVGIPHTVIIDTDGKIAAITRPAKLEAVHLEEILEGKPSTLPRFEPYRSDAETNAVTILPVPPQSVQVSVEGPFPQPDGAFGFRGWEKPDYRFMAQKADLKDVLSAFFDISPQLVIEKKKLPTGLYDVSAVCPPDKLDELKTRFAETFETNMGVSLLVKTQAVKVYAMSVCASNAPGLKPTAKNAGGGQRPGGFTLNNAKMETIASFFEYALNKPVIDETGLPGLWAADIRWEMSKSELSHDGADSANVIRAAREQLGLELKWVKRELQVLVVERPARP